MKLLLTQRALRPAGGGKLFPTRLYTGIQMKCVSKLTDARHDLIISY